MMGCRQSTSVRQSSIYEFPSFRISLEQDSELWKKKLNESKLNGALQNEGMSIIINKG